MNRVVVWKFPLRAIEHQTVQMPRGAKALHVAEQNGQLCLWALCDPDAEIKGRSVRVLGTGHMIDQLRERHVGTVLLEGGALVLHVFVGDGAA